MCFFFDMFCCSAIVDLLKRSERHAGAALVTKLESFEFFFNIKLKNKACVEALGAIAVDHVTSDGDFF